MTQTVPAPAGATTLPVAPPKRVGFLRRLAQQKLAIAGLITLAVVVLVALFGSLISPYNPDVTSLGAVLLPPGSPGYLLGTDELGRDLLSRLISGTQVSLVAALQGTSLTVAIGVTLGLAAGFFRGWVEKVIMFVTDVLMSFPGILLAIAIAGILGPSLNNAMIALGIVLAPGAIRLVRGSVLGVREETYVEAARSIGTPSGQILVRHILPNVVPPLIVYIAILAGQVMLIEAGLSFIGVGVQPPQASWGAMLSSSFAYIDRAPWLAVFPGLMIAISVFALNLLGDGIRDSIGKKVTR
ncbi:ABC transporter permease [Citricoccus sp. NPDC055426]|uniref:ABC transporter permease n=1 Tax=Citricoccus sp. NPDC055426 TaxID=3155536 RepID=UPI003439A5B4